MLPAEPTLHDLLKRIDALERRERESDLELRAALLQIVAQIERKHQIGKYAAIPRSVRPHIDQKDTGL